MGRLATNIGLVFFFIGVGVVGAYFTNYAGFKDWVDINFFSRPPHWQQPIDDPNGIFAEPINPYKEPGPFRKIDDKTRSSFLLIPTEGIF